MAPIGGRYSVHEAVTHDARRAKARVLLADDHAVVRRGLRMVLDAEPDLEVVAEASDGHEAVRQALETRPDLAVLDISMPRMTGLQATRESSEASPGCAC